MNSCLGTGSQISNRSPKPPDLRPPAHAYAAIRDAWLAHCEAHERLGLGALGEESDRLCNAQCDIESKLIAMPSPDRSALLWKLEHLFGPDAWDSDDFSPSWCAKWVNAVMEDARRLLGGQKMPFLVWLEAEKMAA